MSQVELGAHVYVTLDREETNEMLLAFTKALSLKPIRCVSAIPFLVLPAQVHYCRTKPDVYRGHNTEFAWFSEVGKKEALSIDIWKAQLGCFASLSSGVLRDVCKAQQWCVLWRDVCKAQLGCYA